MAESSVKNRRRYSVASHFRDTSAEFILSPTGSRRSSLGAVAITSPASSYPDSSDSSNVAKLERFRRQLKTEEKIRLQQGAAYYLDAEQGIDDILLKSFDDQEVTVEEVIVEDEYIGKDFIERLLKAPSIKKICFQNCVLNSQALEILAENKNINSIVFNNSELGFNKKKHKDRGFFCDETFFLDKDDVSVPLSKLFSNRAVENIEFVDCNIGDKFLRAFEEAASSESSIRYLGFRNCKFSDSDKNRLIAAIKGISMNSMGQEMTLDLSGINLEESDLAGLEVRCLDLSGNDINQGIINNVARSQSLEELRLIGSKVNVSDLFSALYIHDSKVRFINLSGVVIEGQENAFKLVPENVEELILQDMKKDGVEAASASSSFVSLIDVGSEKPKLYSDSVMLVLENVANSKASLGLLDISGNDVDLDFVKSIENFSRYGSEVDSGSLISRLCVVSDMVKSGDLEVNLLPRDVVNPLHGKHEAVQLLTGYSVTESPFKGR